jgi:two-component system cell cycle sensor histidine kinase/response regulator CckA
MPTSRGAHPPGGEERTILVLDDEPEIRKLVATMLSNNGYKVLTATNGESAIKTFKRTKQAVDLVLLDVVSPGLSGPMVADRLTELQPGLRVLYMSGFDSTNVVQRYVVDKGHALITKPFTEGQLVKKVREVLSEEPVV